MHPRNPYQTPPDFKELALQFPEFRKHAKQKLTGKIEIDFKDAAAIRALSTVLLKKDWNLVVELPPDRLVPTLPLRLNYLLWIEDLLALASPWKKAEAVHGVDVGTGACSIYPILAARKYGWRFTATEADETNYQCSLRALQHNNLMNLITLKKVEDDSLLQGNIDVDGQEYDFTMCNPPFFDSDSGGPKSRSANRPDPMCPKSGGSASASEIAVKGGEMGFVQRLIQESRYMKSSIRVFSTMVGHKSSLNPIIAMIKEACAASWTHTELCQGRTMRWAVAWTYCDTFSLFQATCPNGTVDGRKKSASKKPPLPLSYTIPKDRWKGDYSPHDIMAAIVKHLVNLKMEIRKAKETKTLRSIEFLARENTWSNQRRKRREEKRHAPSTEEQLPESKRAKVEPVETAVAVPEAVDASTSSTEQPSFNCKGLLLVEEAESAITLQLQWIEGGYGRESMNQILQYLKNHLFDK